MQPTATDAAPSEQRTRETFLALVSRHLDPLYGFVRHELAAREAAGDLMPGELTVEDVVDDVLLRGYREFVRDPADRQSESWLLRLAKERIKSEVKRLRWEREHTAHIEEGIPETPPTEEASTLGDEILDFFQPDQYLKLEDVVADPSVPEPDEETETGERELRRCVDLTLAELPKTWRRALVLRHVKGLTGPQLAKTLHRPDGEVERILEHARAFLRQRLVEAGCVLKPEKRET